MAVHPDSDGVFSVPFHMDYALRIKGTPVGPNPPSLSIMMPERTPVLRVDADWRIGATAYVVRHLSSRSPVLIHKQLEERNTE